MRWRGNSSVFNSDIAIIPILLEFRWQDEPHRLQWTREVRRISLWLWPTCRPVKLLFWPSKLLCNNFCGHNITSYPPIWKTQNPAQNSTVLHYEGLSWLLNSLSVTGSQTGATTRSSGLWDSPSSSSRLYWATPASFGSLQVMCIYVL